MPKAGIYFDLQSFNTESIVHFTFKNFWPNFVILSNISLFTRNIYCIIFEISWKLYFRYILCVIFTLFVNFWFFVKFCYSWPNLSNFDQILPSTAKIYALVTWNFVISLANFCYSWQNFIILIFTKYFLCCRIWLVTTLNS